MARFSCDTGAQAPWLSRRAFFTGALGAGVSLAFGGQALADRPAAFVHWVAAFRARAIERGISAATYDRVMGSVSPDTSVYAQVRAQPEFTE